jgi:hypothetical protein
MTCRLPSLAQIRACLHFATSSSYRSNSPVWLRQSTPCSLEWVKVIPLSFRGFSSRCLWRWRGVRLASQGIVLRTMLVIGNRAPAGGRWRQSIFPYRRTSSSKRNLTGARAAKAQTGTRPLDVNQARSGSSEIRSWLAALVLQMVPRPQARPIKRLGLSEGAALGVGQVGQLLRPGLQVSPEQRCSKHHEHRDDADGNE